MPTIEVNSLQAILDRVCGEYLEMPGLRLTPRQAQRLWGLDEQTCTRILDELLQNGFLRVTYDGRYARTLDGPAARVSVKLPNIGRDPRPVRRAHVRAS